jgi:hypothetical protein
MFFILFNASQSCGLRLPKLSLPNSVLRFMSETHKIYWQQTRKQSIDVSKVSTPEDSKLANPCLVRESPDDQS